MMKFAICNELFESWEFRKTVRFVAEAGYDGIEIAPFTLADSVRDIPDKKRRELRSLIADAGLTVTGLHWLLSKPEGLHINHPEAAIRKRTCDYLKELIDFCADLGGAIMVFGSPGQRAILPELNRRQGWNLAIETFAAIGPKAAERGVTLCLEALPATSTNFLVSNAEVLAMVKAINHPNIQMMLDVKSMCAEAIPLPDNIRNCQGFFRHVHANDANLRGPGFGAVDFQPIFRALKDLHYDGFVSVEVFDFKPDPATIAVKSLEYMTKTWLCA
jgi:sugar phosphate isomerase/epimerase